MAGHLRDFADQEIDTLAEPILHPEDDWRHRAAVRAAPAALLAIGARRLANTSEGQVWTFPNGSAPVDMLIREPEIVIPALVFYGGNGLFYTRVGDKDGDNEPLWTANAYPVPDAIATDDPESDANVVLVEALLNSSAGVRRIGRLGARATAGLFDRIDQYRWDGDIDQSKAEIAAHYDIDPRLFRGPNSILDQTIGLYSSGLVIPGHEGETDLEELQLNKAHELLRKLDLPTLEDPGDGSPVKVLEVGAGWGGMAIFMAKNTPENVHITSLTISKEQLAYAKQAAEDAGVAHRITFLGEDYRDVSADDKFDRILSVEMIEAVDWRDLGTYADKLVNALTPDGRIVIQAITNSPEQYALERRNTRGNMLATAIFPGGVLHPKEAIQEVMHRRGMRTHETTNLGPSYDPTVHGWRGNLHRHRAVHTRQWLSEKVPADKIARFYRGFSLYLDASQAAFRTGDMQDYQLVFVPDAA